MTEEILKERLEALAVAATRFKKEADKARRQGKRTQGAMLFKVAETLAAMFEELRSQHVGMATPGMIRLLNSGEVPTI